MARGLLLIVLMMCVLCLIACGSKTVVKTEYIYPVVVIPDEPTYYDVNWKKVDGNYCLDIDNAKSLLKNYFILKTYKEELKLILINIRDLGGGDGGTTYP